MIQPADRLFRLLPAVYRERDADIGYPLRSLLRVIAEQVNLVEGDIGRLYDDWFVETCQDWVIPYIGDLIGYRPLQEAGPLLLRRELANTLRYRRRKGTLALLELLARDVAGWPARAIELYRMLDLSRHLDRLRLGRGQGISLRDDEGLASTPGPFDPLEYRLGVQDALSAQLAGGADAASSVALLVWRLRSFPLTSTLAYQAEGQAEGAYTFSLLGNDMPLFQRVGATSDHPPLVGRSVLPIPISRRALEQHTARYYGPGKSFMIWRGMEQSREPVPINRLVAADLTDWDYRPEPGHVAVDPERGRILFHPRHTPTHDVWVSYHHGFSAEMGGGEYRRPPDDPSPLGVSLLRSDDLLDPVRVATRLHGRGEAVSSYLSDGFPAETRGMLAQYRPGSSPSVALVTAIVEGLNGAIQDEALYDAKRFEAVHLPREASLLIDETVDAENLPRLNRLLLEATYLDGTSRKIRQSFGLYLVGDETTGAPHQTLGEALATWRREQPRSAIVEVLDGGAYTEELGPIILQKGQSLEIRAANRKRPAIRLLDWRASRRDSLRIEGHHAGQLVLDGLLVAGRGVRIRGSFTCVSIRHSTLVPGWDLTPQCDPRHPSEPSLELFNFDGRLTIDHSIVGAIEVNQDEVTTDPVELQIDDTIVDATSFEREAIGAPGSPVAHARVTVRRSTILGRVQVHTMDLGENSLFTGVVAVLRRQAGCVRFCSVPDGSTTPRRFHCQPDLDQIERWRWDSERLRLQPRFDSTRYGSPAYCRLSEDCAEEIVRGADDRSEMGVFHDLFAPQRAENLRTRLAEFTPAGVTTELIYAD